MKVVFWGIVVLIIVGVVMVGGGGYYLANKEFDFTDQQNVAKFKETYIPNCAARYERLFSKAKAAPTEEQLIAVNAACKCARDPLVDAFAKRPVMTIAELAKAMDEDPEITAITKACSEAAGLANPQ